MPIDSDLHAAGRRAAAHPVPATPSIATLEAGAAKYTSRRRMLISGAAVVVLVALAFPLALTMRGTTTVQTVAAGTGQAGAQTDLAPPAAQGDTESDGSEGKDPEADEGVRVQLRSGDDVALTIRVISGEAASSAATSAASDATETLDVDGRTVWVRGTGDDRTVSALVEADEFVEITGNASQIDMLIEVLRTGERGERQGLHGFDGLDDAEWQRFFDQLENGEFSFDIEGLDIDELLQGFDDEFGSLFGPDGEFSFDGDFDLDGVEEFFEGNGEFEQFFGPDGEFEQFFGPGGMFSLDADSDGFSFDGDFGDFFGPDGFTFPADVFGEGFDGCIVIDHSGDNDEPMRLEIPEGCSSAG